MKTFFLILSVLVCFGAQASTYLVGQGGYFRLSQDAAADKNVNPTGFSYGGGVGIRKDYLEFEGLFLSASAEDDLVHDGTKNTLEHKQTSLIFAGNFYLNKWLYARIGYGFHKVEQQFGKPMSVASEAGAIKSYNVQESKVTEGLIFGAGAVLIDGKFAQLFTQLEKYSYSSIKSGAWNFTLGLRYHLD